MILPAKITDSRSDRYIKRYGKKSWELDALKPQIIHKIITNEIEKYVDKSKWKKCKQEEQEKRKILASIYDNWAEVKPFLQELMDNE